MQRLAPGRSSSSASVGGYPSPTESPAVLTALADGLNLKGVLTEWTGPVEAARAVMVVERGPRRPHRVATATSGERVSLVADGSLSSNESDLLAKRTGRD